MRRRSRRAALVIAVFTLATTTMVVSTPSVGEAQAPPATIDLTDLDPVPLRGWGVSGIEPASTQTPSLDVLVWDFTQIGNRMFVGGAFLNVQQSKYSEPVPQPYIAAFDLTSGDWINTWRPQLDNAVYSLENLNGRLVVGGEFERVNGTDRTGLVALDPVTGEIDSGFDAYVQRPWSDLRAMVRDMKVVGSDLYVAGNFSHAVGAGGIRTRVYKAARFSGSLGVVDTEWRPEITGSGVWGIDVDPTRGEVHVAGYFSAVNGEAGTGYFHSVNADDGATVPGKVEVPRNYPRSQPEFFDVAVGEDTVWAIGEQHIVQTLRAEDQQMIAYNTTGYDNDGFEYEKAFAGGAYQVGVRIGDWVFAGCHCTYSERNGIPSHYSSVSGRRTAHRLIMAYDARTGELNEDFKPDIHSPRDGTWAVSGDSNGCLWVGGDFHVGGVDSGSPRWLGGFGRFCPHGFDPDGKPPEPDDDTLVAAGSPWRYRDSGADPGTGWRDPGYDDTGWETGSAEFGFGDGDESTVLSAGHLTYYARTSFEFSGTRPTSLAVQVKADDGAVVYLNGIELVRDNMPAGFITHDTPAETWRGGDDERSFVDFLVPADALVDGTNILAAEIHNVWSGNGDLSLDVALRASTADPPEPPAGPLVTEGSSWNYIDDAGATPVGWRDGIDGGRQGPAPLGFGEDDLATELTRGNEAYYFTRTFSVDDAGAADTLMLGLRADDGAVVYLNGTEVKRVNMPDGTIDWSTRPLGWVSGDDEDMQEYRIDADALVAGANVVAVEVHNYWPGNGDLGFDLRLE